MSEPSVSVIVAAHNAESTLARMLDAVLSQDLDRPFEVIVVDDGSTDRTGEVARRADPGVVVVETERSGPGIARNRGAAVARGDVLAFTDADCRPAAGWLCAGLRSLRDRDVVQGLVRADRTARLGPYDRTVWVLGDTALYQTANLFMRRSAFEVCGGFAPWVSPDNDRRGHFGEDVELVWRTRRRGARAGFAPDAVVEHAVVPRSAGGYVLERLRLRHFPGLVRRVPELRRRSAYARLFHTRRSAAFDLAVVGLALAVARRSRGPAVLAIPYAILSWRLGRERGLHHALVELGADAVGLGALVHGSLAARRALL